MSKHSRASPPPQARLTLRISAEKAHGLRQVAKLRGVSVNTLLDEMASLALFEFALVRGKGQQHHGP